MRQSKAHASDYRTMALYFVIALATLAAPIVLWRLPYPFIRLMDAVYHPLPLLQLFVFCASVALVGVGALAFYQDRGNTVHKQLPLLLGILVFFHFLAILRQHAARSWDYACYERAAQAIVQGLNPYGDCYIYFPTPAQVLAWGYQASSYGASLVLTDAAVKTDQLWDLVFYFYEATQFFQLILAYGLCYQLARRLGLEQMRAGLLIALLFVFNNPLLATLKHNQVNLWVLNLILLAMLWLPRYPILSGLAVAIGGHIKLYPLILLLPWTFTRQWRALLATGVGMVGLVLVQTQGGQDWHLWQAFLAFAGDFPKGTFFRDNSLHSLVYNAIGHLKWLLGDPSYQVNEQRVGRIVFVAIAILGVLYLIRFYQRHQHYALDDRQQAVPFQEKVTTTPNPQATIASSWKGNTPEQAQNSSEVTQLGHMMDAIVLGLLISPVVWEHHYLLALPLVIWALASQATADRLWVVALSVLLIFVIPTFDIFPLSYHRLAGLLLLVSTLPPTTVARWSGVHNYSLAFEKT